VAKQGKEFTKARAETLDLLKQQRKKDPFLVVLAFLFPTTATLSNND